MDSLRLFQQKASCNGFKIEWDGLYMQATHAPSVEILPPSFATNLRGSLPRESRLKLTYSTVLRFMNSPQPFFKHKKLRRGGLQKLSELVCSGDFTHLQWKFLSPSFATNFDGSLPPTSVNLLLGFSKGKPRGGFKTEFTMAGRKGGRDRQCRTGQDSTSHASSLIRLT